MPSLLHRSFNETVRGGKIMYGYGACCRPVSAPVAPVAAPVGVGVGIIAIAILILIALGVIF